MGTATAQVNPRGLRCHRAECMGITGHGKAKLAGFGRGARRFGGRPEGGRFQAADGPALLYGWHSVKAALENPARRVRKLMLTENASAAT